MTEYGFASGEVVGVGSGSNLPNLKQNLLMFDKLLLVHRRAASLGGQERLPLHPDLEWLIDQGIVVQQPEPIFGSSNIRAYPNRVIVNVESDEFSYEPDNPSLSLLAAQDAIADVVNAVMCRLESQKLNDSGEVDVIPIVPSLKYQRIEGTTATTKVDVQSIVFRSLPVPDETTSLEHILDFRSDPQTRQQRMRLRKWIREVTQRSPSTTSETVQELNYLLGEYEEHMTHYRIKVNRGILEVLLTTAGEVAENIVKLKWGELAKMPFIQSTKRLDLFEAELKAPGREIAYIQHARDEFGT